MFSDYKNLSAVLYGIDDIRFEDRSIPDVRENNVLVEMRCVGICGSDVHYWKRGRIGDFIVSKPMVIGHESSGVVHAVGSSVKHLKKGDRVALEPGIPCRVCKQCKTGKYNLCKDIRFFATPPYDGCLSKFCLHPADFCYKLPEHVSFEEGALLEPLSVGVHACKRGSVSVGSIVLVLGCGPIGLVTLLTAKAIGAAKVIVTDIVENRLSLAKNLGADYTILIKRTDTEENTLSTIIELLDDLPDTTIDCTGLDSTIKLGVMATKPGGILTVVGMGSNEVKIPISNLIPKEIDIRGVFRYVNDYEAALSLVSSGKVDMKSMITHKYKIEDTVSAFETAHDPKSNAVKVMIYCN